MIYKRASLAAAVAALVTAGAGILAATAVSAPAQAAASSGGAKFAYFTQWGVYGNAYYPKNLDTSGVAGKLDFLVYAFENISPTTLSCFEATSAASQDENNPNAGDNAGDAFADYQKSYGADISVDGVADVYNQPIVGNFNQLKKLKVKYPNLKIQLSIGGWTYSKYFSDAAATAASRQKLVSSCIDMFIKGNLPVQGGYGGTGSGAGIFDGIDIDWEYPGAPGHTGNHYAAADMQNYTLLLQEFRTQLDAYGASVGKKMYLTAAVPAGQDKIMHIETNKVGNYLDYANAMTYDMHGAWDATGPTNHQAPLYTVANDPMTPVPPGSGKYSVDAAVKAWTAGDSSYGIAGGFPPAKLTVGYPLYYRGWTGVPAGSNHGLYQSATGGAAGHPLSGSVAGVSFYKELTGFVDNPSYTYWDDATKSAYFYDGTTFWSGDNAQSIKARADYAHCQGLGGAMMYSLEAGDPGQTLFNAVVNSVNAATPGCVGPSSSPSASTSASASPSASASASRSASPSPSTSPTSGCTAAAWVAATAYNGGAVVSYNGHQYTAKWWTQGNQPDLNVGDGKPWTDNGPCGPTTSPSASPSASPSRSASPSPSVSPSKSASPSPSTTGSYPAWTANHAYAAGDLVTYGGHTYKCLQPHTSLVGWEPPNVPALWQLIS
ncbi:glycosyl hydrolase family 18 protein [Hamadaea tsunoensis]|uniref:glycosyl hydrolase family 18 protein n=1 Tax=Hamadaea tsunoensis TaxID=53368 RepID=UPI0003FA6A6F|nr:glycosyl hydrolase family 18 protein [Hamadaea tsunoensis]